MADSPARSPNTGHLIDAATLGEVRALLLLWFARSARDLPWRRTSDPYAVWVSESMLQQTRVETVIPYYLRWMAAFPTLEALASAPEEQVLHHWQGLGYYSRARRLLAGARAVLRDHRGRVPADVAQLMTLPGVGRYTAGAIASIAFDLPAPIVDGNVARVLTRLYAWPQPLGASQTQGLLWELAEAYATGPTPGLANQALMELGALVCTPRAPRCEGCPLRGQCRALGQGLAVEGFPVSASKKPSPTEDAWAFAIVRRTGAPRASVADAQTSSGDGDCEVLWARRPPEGRFGGLWELPALPRSGDEPRKALSALWPAATELGLEVRTAVSHVLTHRRLRTTPVVAHVPRGQQVPAAWPPYVQLAWVPMEGPFPPLSSWSRKVWMGCGLPSDRDPTEQAP